jgi:hypothetical protein
MASERIQDASAPARLDQPSFQHWERRTHSAAHGDGLNESQFSSESSHASPKSTVPPPRVKHLRRTVVVERSGSAPAGMIRELALSTTAHLEVRRQSKTAEPSDESPSGQQSHQSHSEDIFPQRQGSTIRAGTESKKSSMSSMTSKLRSRLRNSLADFRIPDSRMSNNAKELLPAQEQLGYEWTKAGPKDDWVERLISTSGIMRRRTKSAEPIPRPIVPLRPPASQNISESGYQHTVKLETSFAELRPTALLEKHEQPIAIPRPSIVARTKSVIAKRVHFALHRRTSANQVASQRQSSSTPLGKSRLPTRNRTSEGLQRVASILHYMVADMPSHPASDRSNQSCEPALPDRLKHSNRKGTFHLPTVIRNRARKSTNVSYTSSIRQMRGGPTPANTPDPRETYRVKRSPSADTEEFSKIDISIRGGTSYLPSEATRINTPPLPGDGPGQKRMPFFFDYTAPSAVESPIMENSPIGREELPSSSPTVRPRRARTIGGADWYEMQLAEVDAVGDGASGSKKASELAQAAEDKAVADLNVPEHLPSSPLCPRHRKHKSGGRGVCWMHGKNQDGNGGQ